MRLRRGQITGSYSVARYTAEMMREIVASARKGDTAQHIMDSVRKAGRHLVRAHPLAMVIGNVVRRVLYFIREEYVNAVQSRYSNRSSTITTGSSPSTTTTTTTATAITASATVTSATPSISSSSSPKSIHSSRSRTLTDNDDDDDDDEEGDDDDIHDDIGVDGDAQKIDDDGGGDGDGDNAPEEMTGRKFAHRLDDVLSVSSSTTELDITQQPSILTSVFRPAHLDYSKPVDIKANVIDSIHELIDEISYIYKAISDQATDHVHANEVILTCGFSHTVEHFLKALAKKRRFEVVIAEHTPDFNGQRFAMQISNEGIQTTLVPDSAIFAMMARVNKVLIGTHAVMANGGLIAPCGTHMVALAAKQHSVPVVVCTGLYKLTPLYPVDQYSFNQHTEPSEMISLQDGAYVANVHVYNPAFDYIPPELVSLFITNQGGHNPSYIYRLLSEYYNSEDHVL